MLQEMFFPTPRYPKIIACWPLINEISDDQRRRPQGRAIQRLGGGILRSAVAGRPDLAPSSLAASQAWPARSRQRSAWPGSPERMRPSLSPIASSAPRCTGARRAAPAFGEHRFEPPGDGSGPGEVAMRHLRVATGALSAPISGLPLTTRLRRHRRTAAGPSQEGRASRPRANARSSGSDRRVPRHRGVGSHRSGRVSAPR